MMNLISFETPPPLGRQESTAATAATGMKVAKEASSSDACFHGSNLDLSLGISLSPGGNCSAASCGGAAMASYNGRQGGGNVGRVQSSDMVIASTATANTLSAGRGGNCHGIVPSSSWAAVFMPSPTGFMHPWSLAARQQKAAAEQDRNIAPASVATTYVTSDASVVSVPSAAVGWPPVHTSRRHLVTATHVPKPDAGVKQPDGPKNTKIPTAASPADDDKEVAGTPRSYTVTAEPQRLQANMFAKVHMDGCLIVRKINLRAHRSYDSLSRALTRMTRNFFCPADYRSSDSGEGDCANSDDFIFLYEDFEGDRMLVGDVPWELFLATAKKLCISRHPTSRDTKGHDEAAKLDASVKIATNN
ncbi:hypothetical protein CFC21_057027 [Triticum aestivum]|uniref:Auxin-responsive protein n=3 Tax=Triticum TaxID=4564 RepID=A0A9R0SXW9_TRITD|nr:hypothetical protein CFC21_057027 [Triticum aestivum]VAI03457.1 unnamed protein product [Triticum turgidum subsp. durum]